MFLNIERPTYFVQDAADPPDNGGGDDARSIE